jgi:uncharacterized protein YhdP
VRSLITVALLLVIVGGALVWRLRSGPIPLDFLVPRVKAALDLGPGWQLDVEGVELTWRATAHQVELRARGLRIAPPGDGASVTLAGARIRLSRAALLGGHVVLTAIELDAPALKLVRDAGGRLAMRFDSPEGGTRNLDGVGAMLAKLEHVAIRDGRIAFVDEPSATTWSVPHVDGDLWRAGGPLRVQAELAMAVGEGTVPLRLDAFYRFEAGTLEAQLSSPGANTRTAFAAWPSSLASKAHTWVTKNLSDGRIGTAVLAINGHVVREGTTKLELDSLDASVAFEGLSVRFLDGMPSVTDTKGVARFRRDGVEVAVESGALQRLAVGPGRVVVTWPAGARDRLSVDARCRGPLRDMIEVLDNPPVALGERLSFQSRGMEGEATARVKLAFPLDGPHGFGTLGLRGTASFTDATIPQLAGQWDLSGANGTVAMDERGLRIDGTAIARSVPVTAQFRHQFAKPGRRRLDLKGRLDDAQRAELGVDTGGVVTGPVDVRMRLALDEIDVTPAVLDADLTPATVGILGFDKAAGQPGRAVARLALGRGTVQAIERFDVSAGPLAIRGGASRASTSGTTSGAWNHVEADASFAPPDRSELSGTMQATFDGAGEAWRTVVTSPDLGQVLRSYGYERMRGGRARLEGTADFRPQGAPFEGQITVEDTMFSQVPWLVKLVSFASVKGLIGMGSEQTVVIDRVVATVVSRPPSVIEVKNMIARGPQLGLTLDGTIDRASDAVDLRGTVIPSYYFLNEGADRIPVIGSIIGLATAGALQAVTFNVTGTRAEPVVTVQPLSSLAPGVMREWLRRLGL